MNWSVMEDHPSSSTATLRRAHRIRTSLICLPFLLGMILDIWNRPEVFSLSKAANGAPPVVRKNTTPYDRDWLEVHWVIRNKCNGCHRPKNDRHDFSSYETIMARGPADRIVIPGRPEDSMLWECVNWNHAQVPDSDAPDSPMMPPNEPEEWLTRGQLETLYRWIKNGALEYELPEQCDNRPILETDFISAKECSVCHPKQYEEWSSSMHAYAQHSPTFEAFNQTLLERTGGTLGTFCSRCHTPIGTSIGEPGAMRNVHRSRISMEGVTCVVCHKLQKPFYKASGRLSVKPGQLSDSCLYGPFQDSATLKGTVHEAQQATHLTTSAFCGSCHDVTNPQGIRLEEAFSEWQNSPAAKQGITCQDCHMGSNPGIPIKPWQRPLGKAAIVPGVDPHTLPSRRLSSHTFTGPDYSLLPDTEFPNKLDWMYETDYRRPANLTEYQRQMLTKLRVRNRLKLNKARQLRHQLLRNAAKISVSHPRRANTGDKLKVQVDVTSTTAGHNFPTGFSAERQAWVEVRVTDDQGNLVFVSGDLDPNGDLRDEHSHHVKQGRIDWDKHLMNFQSKFTITSVHGTERSVVIPVNRDVSPINVVRPSSEIAQSFGRPTGLRISKSSLPPLETRTQRYPVRLPDRAGKYHVCVRLNYRHLPPVLLDEIGISQLKHLLEIVVIDEHSSVIEVK